VLDYQDNDGILVDSSASNSHPGLAGLPNLWFVRGRPHQFLVDLGRDLALEFEEQSDRPNVPGRWKLTIDSVLKAVDKSGWKATRAFAYSGQSDHLFRPIVIGRFGHCDRSEATLARG
jgi:hypothetical protein